jgi:succinoglycan biosynthesis transport protein ExoP
MIPKETTVTRPEPTPDAAAITFSAVGQALRRHWLGAVVLVVVSLVAAGLFTFRQRKIYRSTATVQIDPTPPRPLGVQVQTVVDMAAGSYWNNREYYETQLRVITGSGVGLEVVRRLHLEQDGAFMRNLPASAGQATTKASAEAAYGELRSRLQVEPVKNSRLVIISLEDANPGRAQRILSTLLDTFLEQNLDNALTSANTAGEWLGGQVESLKNELERAELELHNYKKSNNILSVSLGEQSNMLRREMADLNDRVTLVRAKLEGINAHLQQLRKVDPEGPAELWTSELLENPALEHLRQQYVEARGQKLRLLGAGHGENHPEVLAYSAQEELLRAEMVKQITNIRAALERDFAAARAEAGGLSGLFKAAEERALDLNLLEIEYRKREREKDNTERLYTMVLERAKESDLTRMMRFNNLHVIEPASGPRSPIRPSLPMNLFIGGAAGLVLGLSFAFGRDRLDRSIKSVEAIERLGIPFLGTLPEVADSAPVYGNQPSRRRARARQLKEPEQPSELVVHYQPSSSVAEAARAIRTSLRFSSPDKPNRCLLVTSAGPSDGKTTVACCIAISMAQAGQRTLLLDCDLRRPRLHKIFGASCEGGTTDTIIDPSLLESVVQTTPVPNLFILPAGPYAPNPADLINSERFGDFLNAVRSHFDMVLIDSPPILPVTDAAILSTRVDGTILIVRSGRTDKLALAKAVRTLGDVGGRIVGAILNGLAEGSHAGGYYYTYYGEDREEAALAEASAGS